MIFIFNKKIYIINAKKVGMVGGCNFEQTKNTYSGEFTANIKNKIKHFKITRKYNDEDKKTYIGKLILPDFTKIENEIMKLNRKIKEKKLEKYFTKKWWSFFHKLNNESFK